MPRGTARFAAATSCGLLAVPLFVSPAKQGAPVARLNAASQVGSAIAQASASQQSQLPVLALSLAGAGAAAAAAARGRGRVQRAAFDPTVELGAQAPVRFWDPLGFCDDGDEAAFRRRRAVELKHGRVAMLAMVGLVAPDFVRLPFEACQGSDLNVVAAHNKLIGPGLGEGPMWWLLVFCSVIESSRFKQLGLGFEKLTLENAGDLGFGNGFLPKSEEGIVQTKIKELKNGRLAMMAFSGAITQAVLWDATTFPWVPPNAVAEPQMLSTSFAGGLTGSGYHGWGEYEWDPAELAARYPEHLPWYREAELKHGRVAMLAMVGLVAPDFFRLPFEQCDQGGLNIVTAHNKLIGPGLGEGPMWWLLVFCSVVESLRFKQLGLGFEKLTLESAGDIGFGNGFLPKSEEGIAQVKTKELKNGRLAMLAFSGVITQAVLWDATTFPWVPANAVGEAQMLSGGFSGGLAGSGYHGWGEYEWDPAELSVRYPEHLPWYREAELKHGRVAMLAMVGLLAPDFFRLPFEQCEQGGLDIVSAHNKLIGPGLGEGPMWWLLVFCSVIESLRFKQLGLGFEKLTLENAGDIGFGNGFLPKSEEGIAQVKTKELKNGRLAMLAFSGAITQAVLWDATRFPWVPAGAVAEEQMLSGPFAGGLAGSDYHGWGKYEWDPAGFTTRYPEHMPWYREAELKHGRVAMLAMVGLVAPDFFRLPFEACEGSDLNMVAAHNKLIGPGLGEGPMWWLLVFCSVIESLRFKQMGLAFEKLTLDNAGDLGFGNGFLPKSEEGIAQVKTKELKNGRLAMMAFSGAITQGVLWDATHFPWTP
mmetsp:Transcript_49163/g.131590  ORF Transcript_49163/g.131590 Transcript_49163/m.131590 type:complete len:815 (-) Transcript_49163:81-2525(-)